MVTVVCTKAFELNGRIIQCGEDVDLAPIDAAIRARVGEVSLLERPTYRTRDLQAAPVKAVEPEPFPIQPLVTRRRGRPRKTKA